MMSRGSKMLPRSTDLFAIVQQQSRNTKSLVLPSAVSNFLFDTVLSE